MCFNDSIKIIGKAPLRAGNKEIPNKESLLGFGGRVMMKLQWIIILFLAVAFVAGCGRRDPDQDLQAALEKITELKNELQEARIEHLRDIDELTRRFEQAKQDIDDRVKDLRQRLAIASRQAGELRETVTQTRTYVDSLRTRMQEAGVTVDIEPPAGLK